MIAFYPQIKAVHVHAIGLSFTLFLLRGALMLMQSRYTHHAALRYLSYAVDTVLLTAALMLATLLQQYPFVHHWLTAKVLLLLAYIVLGSYALKRGATRSIRLICLFAAIACFVMIFLIARAHHWAGPFAPG